MGNSICYGGQRGLSERDEIPASGETVTANADAVQSQDPSQGSTQGAPPVNKTISVEPSLFEATQSEKAGFIDMHLLLTQPKPVASFDEQTAPAAETRSSVGSWQQREPMITTITMIPAPTFAKNNFILQSPEEMTEDVQILGAIGAGAFAVVYRGVYQGGDVAIKLATIDPSKMGWREAFVASQLRHPHVVHTYAARGARLTQEFYDRVWSSPPQKTPPQVQLPRELLPAGPSEDGLGDPRKATHEQQGWKEVLARLGATPNKGLLMLVQEVCDRGNLARAIRSGLFRAPCKAVRGRLLARRMLLRTATEICRGMIHLHKASVVHGDLKPANVLLQSSHQDRRGFVVKISDFGLARMLQQDASCIESETSGTAPYMSPEAFNGIYSKAADVYAFGVVLWEMLIGKQPYESLPVGQIMIGVSFRGLRPPWPEEEWPELCALGRRCLAQEPADRPSFRDLEKELVLLEECLRDESRRQSEAERTPAAECKGSPADSAELPSGFLDSITAPAVAAAAAAVQAGTWSQAGGMTTARGSSGASITAAPGSPPPLPPQRWAGWGGEPGSDVSAVSAEPPAGMEKQQNRWGGSVPVSVGGVSVSIAAAGVRDVGAIGSGVWSPGRRSSLELRRAAAAGAAAGAAAAAAATVGITAAEKAISDSLAPYSSSAVCAALTAPASASPFDSAAGAAVAVAVTSTTTTTTTATFATGMASPWATALKLSEMNL